MKKKIHNDPDKWDRKALVYKKCLCNANKKRNTHQEKRCSYETALIGQSFDSFSGKIRNFSPNFLSGVNTNNWDLGLPYAKLWFVIDLW